MLAEADRRPRTSSAARRSIRSWRRQIGQDTPFPSLELATEDFTGYVGACTPGYSCAYMNTISWARRRRRCRWRSTRASVFERLFGGRARPSERAARMRARPQHPRSRQRRGRRTCSAALGARDQARLERLSRQRARDRAAHPADRGAATAREIVADRRAGRRPGRRSRSTSALMFDLLALAYQADSRASSRS